jgi:hypothetical protein
MRSVRYQGDGDVPIARLLMIPVAAFAVGALVALPFCIKALYLLARHGPVSSSIRQIGIALVRALHQADLIQTPIAKLRVESDRGRYGSVRCSLAGGTTYEQSLFLDALQEILAPIENPRYLLVRKTLLGRFLRKDYHVVPRELARRKQYALYFLKMWSRYVGPAHLVYTRTIEGRTLLLKARANALSTAFQKKSDRAKIWK